MVSYVRQYHPVSPPLTPIEDTSNSYFLLFCFLYTIIMDKGGAEEPFIISLLLVDTSFNYKQFFFRCFAESSLNMETYDAVVKYEQFS